MNSPELLSHLCDIVGSDALVTDPEKLNDYGKDRSVMGIPSPLALVFVSRTDILVELVEFARRHRLGLVPSGGRTGLSGGAVALKGEIIVSFEKMNRIIEFDEVDSSVRVEAGVVTQVLQQFAADQGLLYPVDFASAGSSQIGGNIATNAGGIRVIKYGLTRHQVMGLKVVTGAGQLLNLNHGLVKNATGYDLRHLFIGSEGTLGFITEATLKLVEPPAKPVAMLLAIESMDQIMKVMKHFRSGLDLLAFEFFSHQALVKVLEQLAEPPPFREDASFYVLLEFDESNSDAADQALSHFQNCLELGYVVDGIISQSEKERGRLWRYRESISETIAPYTPWKNDISVKPSMIPAFLSQLQDLVNEQYPDFELIWFGHIGDGNLHLNILKPDSLSLADFKQACEEVSHHVYGLVKAMHGSISAEHGVGLLKLPFLSYSRSEEEIDLMKAIKQTFDPDGIMNPGKLIAS